MTSQELGQEVVSFLNAADTNAALMALEQARPGEVVLTTEQARWMVHYITECGSSTSEDCALYFALPDVPDHVEGIITPVGEMRAFLHERIFQAFRQFGVDASETGDEYPNLDGLAAPASVALSLAAHWALERGINPFN